jgi:sarcosine oxidase gamma subunit
MHDRAQFWSPVPDWSQVALRAPGIDVAPINTALVYLISGDARQPLAQYGISEVLGPRHVCADDSYALRLAPDRLLLVSRTPARAVLSEAVPGCAVTDISDGMLIFDVLGTAAPELMAQGSEYPFNDAPSMQLPHESASMQFAGFRLIVSRRSQGWRLHVERPWAAALWHWLRAHIEQAMQ